jgi:hypothetical protein
MVVMLSSNTLKRAGWSGATCFILYPRDTAVNHQSICPRLQKREIDETRSCDMLTNMKVHGKNILYFPAPTFLKLPRHPFNTTQGAQPTPSHGLLTTSERWQVTEVGADAKSAHVTSKL